MSTTDQGIIVRPRGWQQSYGDGRQGVQNHAGVNKKPFAWHFNARQFQVFLLLTDSFRNFTSDRQFQNFCVLDHGMPQKDSFKIFWLSTPDSFRMGNIG